MACISIVGCELNNANRKDACMSKSHHGMVAALLRQWRWSLAGSSLQ